MFVFDIFFCLMSIVLIFLGSSRSGILGWENVYRDSKVSLGEMSNDFVRYVGILFSVFFSSNYRF